MKNQETESFREVVWDYYHTHGRQLPWRAEPFDAYKILVSEVMLQQTQVQRVIPKYQEFLALFPDVKTLAGAPLSDVIKVWSGLGYNRRAKYLHEAAKMLTPRVRPWTIDDLVACKGIGFNTAAAVVTYAYNQPIAFIETNIRTVFIHHFFAQSGELVADKEIMPLVEQTIDREHPRDWYWALMDYGAYLKSTVGNAARLSKHYTKQPAFHGSLRQLRGQVLRVLAANPHEFEQLQSEMADSRLSQVLHDLEADGLIESKNNRYLLAS